MSYTRGMGDTAADIARVMAGVTGAASSILTSVATPGTTPTTGASTIDPATGLPYGAINPATGLPYGAVNPSTGLPYGTEAPTSYMPIVIGGLVLVGIGGYFLMRKRGVAKNKRGLGRNSANGRDIRLTDSERGKIGTISHNRSFTRRDSRRRSSLRKNFFFFKRRHRKKSVRRNVKQPLRAWLEVGDPVPRDGHGYRQRTKSGKIVWVEPASPRKRVGPKRKKSVRRNSKRRSSRAFDAALKGR